jgi:hypothetical protein
MHILNDPIIAQGANTASRCAWVLGEALRRIPLDEAFCRETEQQLWEADDGDRVDEHDAAAATALCYGIIRGSRWAKRSPTG